KKIINYFERAQSKELMEYIQENEDDFVFKSNLYFIPAVVLATIGCFFYNQAFWFSCITICLLSFCTILGEIHSIKDKIYYEKFLEICLKKEGIIFSISASLIMFILSMVSIYLLNVMPYLSSGLAYFLFYPLQLFLCILIMITLFNFVFILLVPFIFLISASLIMFILSMVSIYLLNVMPYLSSGLAYFLFYPLQLFLCILITSTMFNFVFRLLVPLTIQQTRK